MILNLREVEIIRQYSREYLASFNGLFQLSLLIFLANLILEIVMGEVLQRIGEEYLLSSFNKFKYKKNLILIISIKLI